ncbi:MAG: hypothetical protein FJ026_13415 [Chloroflexi bacterium]|nr:hypothetical protein [Chloroflexota bacterium]
MELPSRREFAVKNALRINLAIALTLTSAILFLVPSAGEGLPLLHISPGHAVSPVDAAALAALFASFGLLALESWYQRERLRSLLARYPGRFVATGYATGLATGLLVASAFPSFRWWWAIGALLVITLLALVVTTMARGTTE